MIHAMVTDGMQYAGYLLEIGLLVSIVRGKITRNIGVALYILMFVLMDGFARPYFLYHFGLNSVQYAYCYWVTDFLLTLSAFLLICFLFRRASVDNPDLWSTVRLMLAVVFILVMTISWLTLAHAHNLLLTPFLADFQQNLYFTCLALNTILYVMMQQMRCSDEELQLLVCGLGIQYAGPAANFALIHLTLGRQYFISLYAYLGPLCTLGMLLTWLYAVTRDHKLREPSRNYQHAMAAVE